MLNFKNFEQWARSRISEALASSSRIAQAVNPYVQFCPWRLGGVSDPVLVVGGPSQGWQFATGNELYTECPLLPGVNRAQPLVFGIAWAALANEVGKAVTWQLDFGFEFTGKDLGVIDHTSVAPVVIPDNSAPLYQRTAIVVAAVDWAIDPAVDEIHVRLTRNVNVDDPVTSPGVHHFAFIQTLKV